MDRHPSRLQPADFEERRGHPVQRGRSFDGAIDVLDTFATDVGAQQMKIGDQDLQG
jgi:hypothetical protein